ncbi:MAG TPA: 4-alpha-glucanotransferase [Thermoanaerobaculia bacterium]|nr:4-alpha-glucanotransferase [Thermoanaerobaculia bacterium]
MGTDGRWPEDLKTLARLHGIEPSYYDIEGNEIHADAESLREMLRLLGVELNGWDEVAERIRWKWRETWSELTEPVTIAWAGDENAIDFRFDSPEAEATLDCRIEFEDGRVEDVPLRLSELPIIDRVESDGSVHVVKRLHLPPLPLGHHRLVTEVRGRRHRTAIVSAPRRCFTTGEKRWGLFAPLYACRSKTSWGMGNIGDLRRLDDWVTSMGGSMVATLPILASFLDEPFEPSPYTPASRLFWNELYLDVPSVPEIAAEGVQRIVGSEEFRREIASIRSAPLVDYRASSRLMRRVLEEMSRHFFASDEIERRVQFETFLRRRPDVSDYARFRATVEKQRTRWREWPPAWRSGHLPNEAYDEEAHRYHEYVQWLMDAQLAAFSEHTAARGGGLYLDYPLGVHPDGYDVWKERDLFVRSVSVGAPPDSFFTRGQKWGFPPLHPDRLRRDGYRYFVETIRHHLVRAGTLRIDHVMALFRLFWIPEGREANRGVYVRYRDEELYAVLALESQRHRSMIVGEDLGTVPDEVRRGMREHDLKRMYVLQYEMSPHDEPPVRPVPPEVVASVNTHDMPPFAAFVSALDVDDRLALGLIDEEEAAGIREERGRLAARLRDDLRRRGLLADGAMGNEDLLSGCLALIAASDAPLVVVNLEDLWGETEPQNVPGTGYERPNWRRKLKWSLEEIVASEELRTRLAPIDRLRKGGAADV